MTPVNLGAQPSSDYLPLGRAQVLPRGLGGETVWPGIGNNLSTGSQQTFISLPAGPACYWRVDAGTIVRTIAAAWEQCYMSLVLTPADADGVAQAVSVMACHNAQTWMSMFVSNTWRIAANTAYTCSLRSGITNANLRYYGHGTYLCLHGYTYGEDTL